MTSSIFVLNNVQPIVFKIRDHTTIMVEG